MNATAVWFTAPRCAALTPEEVQSPGPGEILVRTTTSLVSAGTEMLVYRGEATPDDLLPVMSRGQFTFPIKYGYQCVGQVVDAGPGAKYAPGDRVFTTHPHQDLLLMPDRDDLVFPIPTSVSDDEAIFTNLLRVAIDGMQTCPVKIGDVVVLFGLGVVGALCARLARKTAGLLIVVDPIAHRRSLAIEHGADIAVSPSEVAEAVLDATGGRGADLAVEVSGAPPALQSAIEVTGDDGTVLAMSYFGTKPVELRLAPEFHFRRTRIISSQGGQLPRWDRARRGRTGLSMAKSLGVSDMISHRFPFENAPDAYELIDSRRDDTLAVVLDYA